ncbi:asparagine synthetase B family protein [Rhodoferax koreense]|nr:asparagine synthase-related protein [Rhodoferax koreense]
MQSPPLASGTPRFNDSKLTELARSQGALAAWQKAIDTPHPAQAIAEVDGDFATGFHTATGSVVLAVDRFAIRTLCYREVDGELRFASRADELADASTEIDPQAIFDYLYFHAIPSPRTIFKGIFRLPPGHYAVWTKGKLDVAPYWQPTFAEKRDPSFETLKAEFRNLLVESVGKQLDGSKPACFLSGGTDSSTIAGMIGQACGAPASSYSIGFEAEGYDEMEFARIAAKQFKTRHHEYYVTPADLVRSIPSVAAHFDQPFGNSSVLPSYYCAKMAKEDGVSKLLAGDGGDELFGGNTRYAKQRVFGWYQHLPGPLRRGVMEPLLGTSAARKLPLLSKAASYVEQASVPMPDRLQMYNLIMRLGVQDILTPGFLSQVDIGAPLKHQQEVWRATPPCSDVNAQLAFDWRYTLAETDLPKVLGATSAAQVAVGFPFLDRKLLDFSMGLPSDYKLKGMKLRWFFKEALRGFLPDDIITKKKQGFGLPFGVWALRDSALNALATDSLHSLSRRGIVRPEFIQSLLAVRLAEHPGYFGEMVWILMMLEQWLRRHAPNYRLG